MNRAQRLLLAVNAAPLAVGLLLPFLTTAASVRVAGDLTLCMVWGILQCCLFAGSTWWYENRSARVFDPLEISLTPAAPRTGTARTTGVFNSQGR